MSKIDSKIDILYIIKDFIDKAKKESQYYDQKEIKEIEYFIKDTTPESIKDLLRKAVKIELEALVKKGKIEKVIKNGGAYYKMI